MFVPDTFINRKYKFVQSVNAQTVNAQLCGSVSCRICYVADIKDLGYFGPASEQSRKGDMRIA